MNYHFVIEECNCEKAQLCIADDDGEDCNAYDKLDELKMTGSKLCPACAKEIKRYIVLPKKERK